MYGDKQEESNQDLGNSWGRQRKAKDEIHKKTLNTEQTHSAITTIPSLIVIKKQPRRPLALGVMWL